MRFRNLSLFLTAAFLVGMSLALSACAQDGDTGYEEAEPAQEEAPVTLGPKDGLDLPAMELERVAVGMTAPDFSLESLDGNVISLSQFQGAKEVILVFYRGHW